MINGVSYIKKQIATNKTTKTRTKSDIKAVVIHYTANYNRNATAKMHYEYFNKVNRSASADVFIDDHSIWKVNDWYKYYTWAIGDGHGKYGYWNNNTISIEMCVNSDGNFKKTMENTIAYIRYLHKNGFTKKLVRHYDCSKKLCPVMFIDLNIKGYNKLYTDFRNKVFAVNSYSSYKDVLKDVTNYSSVWIKAIELLKKKAEAGSDLGDLESFKYIDIYILKRGNKQNITDINGWNKAFRAIYELSDDRLGEFKCFKNIYDLNKKLINM